MGGVYISPYTALIGSANDSNLTQDGVSTSIICDDFTVDVSTNTPPWQAIVSNVASINNGTTASTQVKFDHTNATQQQQDYATAAFLAEEILAAQHAGNTTLEGALSFAEWGLFDPTSIDPNGPFSGKWITGSTLANAESDLSYAQSHAGSYANYSNVYIYTPTPASASQEYLVVRTPEPPAALLLGVDMSALLGLIALLSRRARRTAI